jgi:hypothetical protein
MDFDIPLGVNGDTYDRYLVRVEEIARPIASSSSASPGCGPTRPGDHSGNHKGRPRGGTT